MRRISLRNWAIVGVVCATMSVAYRLNAIGQLPVIGSLGTFATVQTGNLVVACNGCGEVPWTPGTFTSGSWLGANQNGGSNGEFDFINLYPSGSLGGFAWFSQNNSSLHQIMGLSQSGTLTVSQLAGNAATATLATNATHATTAGALSGTPTQCPTGATGIAANGNANCISTTYDVQSLIITTGICTTSNSAYSLCGPIGPYNWPHAFADGSYSVSCSAAVPTSTTGGSTVGTLQVYLEAINAGAVSLELQNGSGNGAGANTTGLINCLAQHL